MKTLLELITIEMKEAFEAAGYDAAFAKVTLSNRPDLCEYQCNGAMAAAKTYKKAPIMIANDVVAGLQEKDCFETAEAVNPGFINLKVNHPLQQHFSMRWQRVKSWEWKRWRHQRRSWWITADRMWQNRCM